MKESRQEILRLLKTSKGQIEGIIKMIEDDKYCIDISNQIMACNAILKKANLVLLDNHIHSCVLNATEEDKLKKMDEISGVLKKVL